MTFRHKWSLKKSSVQLQRHWTKKFETTSMIGYDKPSSQKNKHIHNDKDSDRMPAQCRHPARSRKCQPECHHGTWHCSDSDVAVPKSRPQEIWKARHKKPPIRSWWVSPGLRVSRFLKWFSDSSSKKNKGNITKPWLAKRCRIFCPFSSGQIEEERWISVAAGKGCHQVLRFCQSTDGSSSKCFYPLMN